MKFLKVVLSIFVLGSFAFFVFQTDLKLTLETLKQVGFEAFWVLLSTFLAYLLGTLGWFFCLENRNVSIVKLFMYRSIGETLSLFNPTSIIAGDALKALYLENHGISRIDTARSVVLSRIMAVLSQILLLSISLLWLGTKLQLPSISKDRIVIFFLGILSLFSLLAFLYKKYLFKKFAEVLKTYIDSTRNFLKKYPLQAFFAFVLFFLHWIIGALELYILLKILGYDISVFHAIFMDMGIILVKSFGAFVPGQIGVEELGNKLVLQGIGIASTHVWLSISILRRSRQIFWALFGFIAYIFNNKYGNLIRKS